MRELVDCVGRIYFISAVLRAFFNKRDGSIKDFSQNINIITGRCFKHHKYVSHKHTLIGLSAC